MEQKLVSICIPTYSRPTELKRLLESIDTKKIEDVDIVISENCSPKQAETRAVVEEYKQHSPYEVHYFENEKNYGYDRNIRELVGRATGRFCVFFSDDDLFMPGAMDEFVEFIRAHQDCGYILRSYRNYMPNGIDYQDFRYYGSDREFPAGEETAIELFDKSVFLSGFTIRQEYAKNYVTDAIDGTLLYQMYLLLEVCSRYTSAYSRIIISKAVAEAGGIHYFGESDNEKDSFTTGMMLGNNDINFIKKYYVFFNFVEKHFNKRMADKLRVNFSKYSSYPAMMRQLPACKSRKSQKAFYRELESLGMDASKYYYIYKLAFSVFGVKGFPKIVNFIKRKLGHRPRL